MLHGGCYCLRSYLHFYVQLTHTRLFSVSREEEVAFILHTRYVLVRLKLSAYLFLCLFLLSEERLQQAEDKTAVNTLHQTKSSYLGPAREHPIVLNSIKSLYCQNHHYRRSIVASPFLSSKLIFLPSSPPPAHSLLLLPSRPSVLVHMYHLCLCPHMEGSVKHLL